MFLILEEFVVWLAKIFEDDEANEKSETHMQGLCTTWMNLLHMQEIDQLGWTHIDLDTSGDHHRAPFTGIKGYD